MIWVNFPEILVYLRLLSNSSSIRLAKVNFESPNMVPISKYPNIEIRSISKVQIWSQYPNIQISKYRNKVNFESPDMVPISKYPNIETRSISKVQICSKYPNIQTRSILKV